MSEITRLEVQVKDKERANLYLDDKFYAGVSVELCIKNHLKVGQEIDNDFLENLILEDEKSRAFDKSIKYIGSSLKTKKQIREYLNKKEYNKCTIDYVIDKLCEYRYVDDSAFTRAYINTYSSKYGKLKLVANLKQKGVAESIIDDVLSEKGNIGDSIEKVANKYLKNKIYSNEVRQKLARFLCSRGYTWDEVSSFLNKLKGE